MSSSHSRRSPGKYPSNRYHSHARSEPYVPGASSSNSHRSSGSHHSGSSHHSSGSHHRGGSYSSSESHRSGGSHSSSESHRSGGSHSSSESHRSGGSYSSSGSHHRGASHSSSESHRSGGSYSSSGSRSSSGSAGSAEKQHSPERMGIISKPRYEELKQITADSKSLKLKKEQLALAKEIGEFKSLGLKQNDAKAKQFDEKQKAYNSVVQSLSAQVGTLGEISIDVEHIFKESKDAIACATQFLRDFYEDNSRAELANKNGGVSCISFVTANIKNKKCCFVAVSISNQNRLLRAAMYQFSRMYTQQSTGYKFIPLIFSDREFQSFLTTVLADMGISRSNDRPCAEIIYSNMLVKLFRRYGNDLIIEGSANCLARPRSITELQESFAGRQHIEVTKDRRYTAVIPCCQFCKALKDTILVAASAAKDQREKERQANSAPALPFSPVVVEPLKDFLREISFDFDMKEQKSAAVVVSSSSSSSSASAADPTVTVSAVVRAPSSPSAAGSSTTVVTTSSSNDKGTRLSTTVVVSTDSTTHESKMTVTTTAGSSSTVMTRRLMAESSAPPPVRIESAAAIAAGQPASAASPRIVVMVPQSPTQAQRVAESPRAVITSPQSVAVAAKKKLVIVKRPLPPCKVTLGGLPSSSAAAVAAAATASSGNPQQVFQPASSPRRKGR